ncbi:hypothetical protein TUM20985_52130 [Mycobacterium antarcticum]|uniref:hypothetical protein n=1 Tax=unclassified Mycolicibacterium TaxID=2636767 RepID=UPI00239E641F|nr:MULTISPECIES: hypothetical protein [unclassified Mycolicibacterium]BDX34666.1 hypothetical protein TUM20985_52130 [Mycolicibacterium sp. TUM20985]GLP81729.1 hypothetical protein TUM20984_31490 [Mycolicibacterium sp. TUM20984]
MRAVVALLLALVTGVAVVSCSKEPEPSPYATQGAKLGESLAVLGWNVSASNLRFDGDYVLLDVDAAPSQAGAPHAKVDTLRFGLYGALAHPIESTAVGSCSGATDLNLQPAASPNPDKLSGTVCLGPLRDQTQVRGVYLYSPQDRIPGTIAAYGASFPVGLTPTGDTETGLVVKSTSVDAFDAGGSQLMPTALGEPNAFTGNGYMLLGLDVTGLASRYRDDSIRRGGPMMIQVTPTLPGKGLSYACSVYGSSMLVLPDASLDAVAVRGSLCTQGEINQALLYATVAVVGTHAALWTTGE